MTELFSESRQGPKITLDSFELLWKSQKIQN